MTTQNLLKEDMARIENLFNETTSQINELTQRQQEIARVSLKKMEGRKIEEIRASLRPSNKS